MWKSIRKRAREAVEKLKKEKLGKKEPIKELKEKVAELKPGKKEPAKKVDTEREKAEKAMGRLRTFVPKVPPVPPSAEGKPAIEIYNGHDAYRDIQTILQYLMKKQEGK